MPAELAEIAFAGIGDEAGPGIAAQLAATARLGWPAIELRTVDGVAVSDLDRHAFAAVVAAVHGAGLRVVCLDSRIGNWARPITGDFADDLSELDSLAPRCAALGTRYVRIMSYPNDGLPERRWRQRVLDRIRRLVERAEVAGIVLLHENCAGWAGDRAERMLALLAVVDSPALRLLFDTGNGVAHGYQAHGMLAEIVPHVAHVHVKDVAGERSAPRYTLPGHGTAMVADCLRLLTGHGYTGSWSIEPHLTVRPHEGGATGGLAGCAERFVAAGAALERLVDTEVLPHADGWVRLAAGRIAMAVR